MSKQPTNLHTVQQDELGLYVKAGGYIARPVDKTRYKAGRRVLTRHFSGTTLAGVGKRETSRKGEYVEYWTTTGLSPQCRGLILWYTKQTLSKFRGRFKRQLTPEELKIADDWVTSYLDSSKSFERAPYDETHYHQGC